LVEQGSSYQLPSYSSGDRSFGDLVGDDIADAVLGAAAGAAARFLGRPVSRRVQDRLTQQVLLTADPPAGLADQGELAEPFQMRSKARWSSGSSQHTVTS